MLPAASADRHTATGGFRLLPKAWRKSAINSVGFVISKRCNHSSTPATLSARPG